nr:MAG TPA: hypothetical protein [Bacteriophage sp.]
MTARIGNIVFHVITPFRFFAFPLLSILYYFRHTKTTGRLDKHRMPFCTILVV